MKKYLSSTIVMFLGVITLVGLSGCGAKGKQFNGFIEPKNNKGILYVYRPTHVAGSALKHAVYDVTNGKEIGTLRNGGYVKYETKPGKYTIAIVKGMDTSMAVAQVLLTRPTYSNYDTPPNTYTVNIKQNDIVCLLWDPARFYGPYLGIVDKVTCRNGIAKTNQSFE